MSENTLGYASPPSSKMLVIAPPGRWLLGCTIAYWLIVLIFQRPSVSIPFGMFILFGGLLLAGIWTIRLVIWIFAFAFRAARWNPRRACIAVAPAIIALVSILLLGYDVPLKLDLLWNKSKLDALAARVISQPEGTWFPNCKIGRYELINIRKEAGSFVCEVRDDGFDSWGFAYVVPPMPPTGYLFTRLWGNWYYWKD